MPAPRKNVPNHEERLEMHWKASQRKPPKYDYLKYYKIVRQWVKYKYGVSLENLGDLHDRNTVTGISDSLV